MNNLENIKGVTGYKVFKSDWTCRGFQYKVGKTYKYGGEIGLCKGGFHFCRKLIDCFEYYRFNPNNKVAIIVATGEIRDGEDKSVTNEITIMKEISWHEVLDMINTGNGNTGDWNSGNGNTGNWNTGNENSGDFNSGDCNTGNGNVGHYNIGNGNSGYYNTGNGNVGHYNIGNGNSGYYNTGNKNSGDFNSGTYNSGDFNIGNGNSGSCNSGNGNSGDFNITNYSNGVFNTKQNTINFFDKPSNWTYEDWLNSNIKDILYLNFKLTKWIDTDDMTEEEKEQHLDYKTTDGYLKKYTYKEAWKNMWNELTEKEKEIIVTELPNFDKDIFKEITGIDVNEDDK